MKIEEIEIEKLIPYVRNNKIHNEQQITKIASSLKEFGFKQPIVIDKENVVIIGHGRLEAAKKLQMKKVPCLIADDLNKSQIKALRIADNKLNESEWNFEFLQLEIEELKENNFNIEFTGFEDFEINQLNDNESNDIEEIENINMYYNFIIKCEGLKELEQLKEKLKVTSEKVKFKDIML